MVELGTKYECEECGAKFYDLQRDEFACPKCGTDPNADDDEDEEPAKDKAQKGK